MTPEDQFLARGLKDRVQLADTSPWKGMPDMSDTDSTYSMTAPPARPSTLGDLRFAGTVATGLVAGTLGLGALAAPLVGWQDWPSALTQQATSQPVVLAKPAPAKRQEKRRTQSKPRPASNLNVVLSTGLPGGSGRPGAGPRRAIPPQGLKTFVGTAAPSEKV